MALKEEPTLATDMQKLELESNSSGKLKSSKPPQTEESLNPFMQPRKRSKSLSSINLFASSHANKCICKVNINSLKHTTSFKRYNKKILREPVLKFINQCANKRCKSRRFDSNRIIKLFGQCNSEDKDNFRSIIDGCGQLSLANANDGVQDYSLPSFRCVRIANGGATIQGSLGQSNTALSDSASISCAHQARITPPCDITIDELASYFETFVHIPKKMSSMAEMMYT